MAHLTSQHLTALNIRFSVLEEMASKKGLEATIHISMYGYGNSLEEPFDTLSLRVEEQGAEDSLYYSNISYHGAKDWDRLTDAFTEAFKAVIDKEA